MSVKIKNIQKAFGAKEVLNGIDLTLEDDGIYCLMGPSGMGKTTLLRIMMDLEDPDSGMIEDLGKNDIAVMFQENRLLEWMDAVDNVAVMRKEVKNADAKKKIEENLKLILPEDCLHQPVAQLSGGMKRRVALARAMNFPSKLIILDEPFTGLDRQTKMEVIDYILEMRAGRILLVATHGVEDAALLGAKIIRLEELLGLGSENGGDGSDAGGGPGSGADNADDGAPCRKSMSRDEIMKNMNLFRGISAERYHEIIEKLHGYEVSYRPNDVIWEQGEHKTSIGIVLCGTIQAADLSGREPQIIQQFSTGDSFGEAVALGGQSSWVEIRALKNVKVLYLPVDELMADLSDRDFTLMKTNLVREMSNKLGILNLKNQLLAEPRLRRRILMYPNMNASSLLQEKKYEKSDRSAPVVTPQMKRVLDYLEEYGEISDGELQELLNIKKTRAYLLTRQMHEEELIDIIGKGTAKKYRLKHRR